MCIVYFQERPPTETGKKTVFSSGHKVHASVTFQNCTLYATELHKYDMTVVMNVAADGEPKATSRLNNVLLKMNASFVTHTSCCEISIGVLMKRRHPSARRISS